MAIRRLARGEFALGRFRSLSDGRIPIDVGCLEVASAAERLIVL